MDTSRFNIARLVGQFLDHHVATLQHGQVVNNINVDLSFNDGVMTTDDNSVNMFQIEDM